jgi:multidrug efflux system membrane fusion protein
MNPDHPATPSPSRHRWRVLAVALVLAGGAAAALRAHQAGSRDAAQAAAGARTVPVVAEPARVGDVRVYLSGIGAVTPLATVTVRSRVDGQLDTVRFEEGQTVHGGDLLAEIDPRPFQVQLAQAEGQMTRDQALMENAKVDLQRYRVLAAQDSIPKQQLDTQEALVRQYAGAIVADRGPIDAAKLQLDYCRITAPLGGRIGLRLVDPGNMVHASDAGGLAVITQVQPIAVVFTIPEDNLPALREKIRAGVPLPVEAFDRDGSHRLASGTLLTTDNAIDPTTGTVRLKAVFPNDDEALFPNQFVNARLELDVHRGVTLVPDVAVQHGTQGTFVYVVKDDHTVEARPVKVNVSEEGATSVDTGVAAGEQVVVDGAEGLRPGSAVTLEARRHS